MDFWTEVEQFISNNAFPILMCLLLLRKITESDEASKILLTELKSAIQELTHYIKEHDNGG